MVDKQRGVENILRWSLLAFLLVAPLASGAEVAESVREDDGSFPRLPAAHAGPDRVVLVNEPVAFHGYGSSADHEIVEYTWDFDNDGSADAVSVTTGAAAWAFAEPGEYRSTLTVRDTAGLVSRDRVRILVVARPSDLEDARARLDTSPTFHRNPPDGVVHRYAIMINGGSETRYWRDVELGWDMLTAGYGLQPDDIYLLNHNGTDPYGDNPDGMIDDAATVATAEAAFDDVAARSDEDDEVFIWITDHGRGYEGPESQGGIYLGYMDGRASVDPGDEADFPETGFPLRSIFTGGDYRSNHGMNVWKVRRWYYNGRTEYYRNQYVSKMKNVYIESVGARVRDDDVFIERLLDYLLGDLDRDGWIDTGAGEVFDYDGDGQQPYDHSTGVFDEDDWGEIDDYEDDYNKTGGGLPEGAQPIKLFDDGFTGNLCIDLGYAGGDPEVDGRDEDGAGLFDWMDVNQDGDLLDSVSVDEGVVVYADEIWDDKLDELIDRLSVAKVALVALPCYSGGLIHEVSAAGRILCTATREDTISYGDVFIRGFTAALHGKDEWGDPVDADANGNGYVDMVEAFNYAAEHDAFNEIPQYDDDGDGISHTDPIPDGDDGVFGADAYLCECVPFGAGRVPSDSSWPGVPLTVEKAADGITLQWGPSCLSADQDYAIYEGDIGDFTSHGPIACTTGWRTDRTFQLTSGDKYYLVVPRNSSLREGSYGSDGDGAERPAASSPCLEQLIADCP